MLSLTPRADLFVFNFPKDFLPAEIEEKYAKILTANKSVIQNPIDYLNESIQGITFPGITDLLLEQDQHSISHPENIHTQRGINGKRISIEPQRSNVSYSTKNILSQVSGEFTVTLRKNQGLYNYFMIYETIFYKCLKQFASNTDKLSQEAPNDQLFFIDILDESGTVIARLKLFQPKIDGIDGLEFSYNKTERQNETFDIKFRFNNIDFDIMQKEEN
jgi:hypothetical protein